MRSVYAALLLALGASPALAQRAPVIVIPGWPGVPVLMNGVDVSWSVIEGEFGLDRPGEVTPTVIYRPFAIRVPYDRPGYYEPGYFPATGQRPGYGRLEIVPPQNRRLPPPAPTYFRSWSSRSEPGPATVYAPSTWSPNNAMRAGREGGEGRQDAQPGQDERALQGSSEGAPPAPGHGRK